MLLFGSGFSRSPSLSKPLPGPMAFSEEIKIEALRDSRIRFGEISIMYSSRMGETKLNLWRDGFQNLAFLAKKRFLR